MSAPYQKEFLPGERKESRLQNPIIFEYLLYWLLILLGLVPFVAGAYVYLRYQPPVYAVSSELLLWLWQIRSLWQVWLWQEVWVWIREEVVFLPTKVVPPPYLLPTSSLSYNKDEVGRRSDASVVLEGEKAVLVLVNCVNCGHSYLEIFA